MKQVTFLIFILFSVIGSSQYQKGTLVFKNNTSKEGFIKVRSHDGIKFKENENDKPVVYNHLQVASFIIDDATYSYVRRNKNDYEPKIYKEVLKGAIDLYVIDVQGGEYVTTFGNSNLPVIMTTKSTSTYYMVMNDKLVKIGRKLRNRHLKMLQNCTSLISKIDEEEILKTNVVTAIDFYNINCGKVIEN